ncbi:hypothetical protein AJ90_19320 [Vibrio parahaemolyticus M0605]|nr:hypothetical protein AJ90_19320 [Vibrio parahaemolyticus M0605]
MSTWIFEVNSDVVVWMKLTYEEEGEVTLWGIKAT